MKLTKGLIICIILLLLLTYCNIVIFGKVGQEVKALKAEHAAVSQKHTQIMEELRCKLQLIDLFGYIRTVNPKLTHKETTEFMYLVFAYAEEFGVDPYMIFAKARVESDFNPHTPGLAGEQGFIQVMEKTFALYLDEFGYTMDDFNKWQCSLKVGIAHFGYLMDKHSGNWMLAEAEYNAGPLGDFAERAGYHVRKVVLAKKQVSRFREKGM